MKKYIIFLLSFLCFFVAQSNTIYNPYVNTPCTFNNPLGIYKVAPHEQALQYYGDECVEYVIHQGWKDVPLPSSPLNTNACALRTYIKSKAASQNFKVVDYGTYNATMPFADPNTGVIPTFKNMAEKVEKDNPSQPFLLIGKHYEKITKNGITEYKRRFLVKIKLVDTEKYFGFSEGLATFMELKVQDAIQKKFDNFVPDQKSIFDGESETFLAEAVGVAKLQEMIEKGKDLLNESVILEYFKDLGFSPKKISKTAWKAHLDKKDVSLKHVHDFGGATINGEDIFLRDIYESSHDEILHQIKEESPFSKIDKISFILTVNENFVTNDLLTARNIYDDTKSRCNMWFHIWRNPKPDGEDILFSGSKINESKAESNEFLDQNLEEIRDQRADKKGNKVGNKPNGDEHKEGILINFRFKNKVKTWLEETDANGKLKNLELARVLTGSISEYDTKYKMGLMMGFVDGIIDLLDLAAVVVALGMGVGVITILVKALPVTTLLSLINSFVKAPDSEKGFQSDAAKLAQYHEHKTAMKNKYFENDTDLAVFTSMVSTVACYGYAFARYLSPSLFIADKLLAYCNLNPCDKETAVLDNLVTSLISGIWGAFKSFLGEAAFLKGFYYAGYAHGYIISLIIQDIITFGTSPLLNAGQKIGGVVLGSVSKLIARVAEGGLEGGGRFLLEGLSTAAKPLAEYCKSGLLCFVAGTAVATPEGYKNIEAIKPYDIVYAYDIAKNKTVVDTVINTTMQRASSLVSFSAGTKNINCTLTHPFYVNSGEWKEARALSSKDSLWTSGNKKMQVQNWTFLSDTTTNVYNLTVKNNSNYFVTENNILSHNTEVCLITGAIAKAKNWPWSANAGQNLALVFENVHSIGQSKIRAFAELLTNVKEVSLHINVEPITSSTSTFLQEFRLKIQSPTSATAKDGKLMAFEALVSNDVQPILARVLCYGEDLDRPLIEAIEALPEAEIADFFLHIGNPKYFNFWKKIQGSYKELYTEFKVLSPEARLNFLDEFGNAGDDLLSLLNKDISLLGEWKTLVTEAERKTLMVAFKLEIELINLNFSQKISKIINASISKNSKIRLFEKTITGQSLEHGLILDDTGKLLAYKEGTANQLSYSEYAGLCKDKILSHNHPANSSFSVADIQLLDEGKNLGLAEVRAVTENEIYILKRTANFDSNAWFFAYENLKPSIIAKYPNLSSMTQIEKIAVQNELFIESFKNFSNINFIIIKK